MTARDETKKSDRNRGRNFTAPKGVRPKAPVLHQVSDHATLRYFERVLNLDVEAIRETILTPDQKRKAEALKDCTLPLGGGVVAIVKSGRVVTIK